MFLSKPSDILHKVQMYRLLSEIIDEPYLSQNIFFKGGTCAAMLGYLDRFSVDLDFDLKVGANKTQIHTKLVNIFAKLNMVLDQKSSKSLFYILKYDSMPRARNNLKLSIVDFALHSNSYNPRFLSDIDRLCICQTIETMFANKLVAVIDRYEKHTSIAGRDIYDIHHFFLKGFRYEKAVIEERTGLKSDVYLKQLYQFIENRVTDKIITEDLSFLLESKQFQLIRKVLKKEVLLFLKQEMTSEV